MGSAKRKNTKLRRALKNEVCTACGVPGSEFNPIDPAHVLGFKAHQSDHPANIIPLCRKHHREQHDIGWKRFLEKYNKVWEKLADLDWTILFHPFQDSVILTHPEIK